MNPVSPESNGPGAPNPPQRPLGLPGPSPLGADGHIDLPYFMMRKAPGLSFTDLEDGPFTPAKARSSGLRLFCTALYCEDRFNGSAAFRNFQELLRFSLDCLGQDLIIRSMDGLKRLQGKAYRLGTVLLLENADPLVGHLSEVPRLKAAGVLFVGLTHIGRNRIADGNSVVSPLGITREGRDLIQVLDKNGLGIDVAHLHPQCFWELMKQGPATVLTSHTGVRELCDLPRNIDLHQARAILERKGMIGITFNPEMLSPERCADIALVFRHMDTLVQRFGPEGIGIGSDLCGFDLPTEGLEDVRGIERLGRFMLDSGYGEEATAKILGLNWVEFIGRVL